MDKTDAPAPQAQTSPEDVRAAFENWQRRRYITAFERNPLGTWGDANAEKYAAPFVQCAWEAWQVAFPVLAPASDAAWRDGVEAAAKVADDYALQLRRMKVGEDSDKDLEESAEMLDRLASDVRALSPPSQPAGEAERRVGVIAHVHPSGNLGATLAAILPKEDLPAAPTPAYQRAVEDAGWRDIASAPKDGTGFDLWATHPDEGAKRFPICRFWRGVIQNELGQRFFESLWVPTHWMPLPSPPSSQEPQPRAPTGEGPSEERQRHPDRTKILKAVEKTLDEIGLEFPRAPVATLISRFRQLTIENDVLRAEHRKADDALAIEREARERAEREKAAALGLQEGIAAILRDALAQTAQDDRPPPQRSRPWRMVSGMSELSDWKRIILPDMLLYERASGRGDRQAEVDALTTEIAALRGALREARAGLEHIRVEVDFAERDERDGDATESTRRIRFEWIGKAIERTAATLSQSSDS